MVHKDTFGNSLVPKHGQNYEALNRCMLSDTIDALNVEVRNIQGNVAASDPLLSALAQIKQAYDYHMQQYDKLDFDAPLRESFELDRISYAKQIQVLIECIQSMIKSSSIVCDNAHKLEITNNQITNEMKHMKRSHSTELRTIKDDFERKRIELEDRVARDYERLKSFKQQADSEIKVKDALIVKLTSRNHDLEESLKKAVTIMQNPNAMKEAFIKYNLDKVIYSKSPSPTTQEGQRESPVHKMNTTGLNSSSDEVLIGSRKA